MPLFPAVMRQVLVGPSIGLPGDEVSLKVGLLKVVHLVVDERAQPHAVLARSERGLDRRPGVDEDNAPKCIHVQPAATQQIFLTERRVLICTRSIGVYHTGPL